MGTLELAEERKREGLEGLEADWWLGTRTSILQSSNLFQIIF